MKHLFTLFTALLLAASFPIGIEAQNYGHAYYQHSSGGSTLCHAFTSEKHLSQPGYMMASYKPISLNSAYNFALDRTSLGGAYLNPNMDFKKIYRMYADPSAECNEITRPVDNCAGVSIIETEQFHLPGSQQGYYALAGAFDKACFFSLVDNFGNCFNSCAYRFPAREVISVTKPLIIECSNASGHYLICGSFNKTMYVIRVNEQGQIIWSKLYPIEGEPRDMIAAAYGPNKQNEFIVVGKSFLEYATNKTDAFVMKLDQNNGSVLLARRVNIFTINNVFGDQHFNSICLFHREQSNLMTNYGYLLTGYTDPFSIFTTGNGLYHRLDTNLNFVSIGIFRPANSPNNGEIMDVLSRKKPNVNSYHYYSLVKNDNGMGVIRTNWNLLFSPQSILNGHAVEFDFSVPGSVTQPVAISMYNVNNSPYEGIQLFGNVNSTGTIDQHLVKSYFNGVTACHSSSISPFYMEPASQHPVDLVVPYGELTACPLFHISDEEDGSYVNYCGPLDSVLNGDNSRMALLQTAAQAGAIQLKLYPNPSQGLVNLEYDLQEAGDVEISLCTLLGQEVLRINETKAEAGHYQLPIDLAGAGLDQGIYILTYKGPHHMESRRIAYER